MKLIDLWLTCPQTFVMLVSQNNEACSPVKEYKGTKDLAEATVTHIYATSYPMYKSVLEVKIQSK